jgi:hypothetical protein
MTAEPLGTPVHVVVVGQIMIHINFEEQEKGKKLISTLLQTSPETTELRRR